jgi:Tol biopolymer transport system component
VVAQTRLLPVLLACGLYLLLGCQVLNRGPSPDTLQGRIAWPKDGDLWVLDLSNKQEKKVTDLPRGAAVTGAAWSPDGSRLVYAQFGRRPNERASGADLVVANADGSNAHLFAERDTASTVLDTPLWAPSGRVYYTIRRIENGREAQTIVRKAETGEPEMLVENGYSPAVSADESVLVYLRTTRAGQAMLRKPIGQPGDGCELLSDQVFQYLSQPRVSPDGTRVALGGSGEANPGPSSCGANNADKPSASSREASSAASGPGPMARLAGWLADGLVSTAYAHGLPADIYTLGLDGAGLQRIADIKDDDPTVAWSPDGSRLAIFGVAALYMVDSKGGPSQKLVDQGGYGGLDWTK